MIPTIEEGLALLAANPQAAAAFDTATRRERPHCKTRREAVAATLEAFECKRRENAAMRAKLAAARQRIAALERAKGSLGELKASVATNKARLAAARAKPSAAKPRELSASELLALPDSEAAALLGKAAFGDAGRSARAAIKRALMSASPIEKGRLYERFEAAITAFPNEIFS